MARCRSKHKKSLSPPPNETNHSPTSCELAMPHRHFCDVSQCVHDVLAPSMTVTRGYARLRAVTRGYATGPVTHCAVTQVTQVLAVTTVTMVTHTCYHYP